jgi:arylsulfatase A
MKIYRVIISFTLIIFLFSCSVDKEKPNVILIMADDLGFEALGINGADDYNTPVLDSLARNGINFTSAYSQPLCTPTRVKIMTGKPNYENYEYFTYLNPNQRTFGNLFQEKGYKTSIVGKWQLNGVQYDMEFNQDKNRPYRHGFDDYCLWWLTERGDRFANPNIFKNGELMDNSIDDYGPDIFADHIVNFIEKNKDEPFFIYYPMVLVHDPFIPTPDSEDWNDLNKRNKGNNPIYFSEMLTYMDKVVGRISNALKQNDLDKNTILIFTGDNGTDVKVKTKNKGIEIQGSKGLSIKYASNVPLIINWNDYLKGNKTSDAFIDFVDFYATFEEILGVEKSNPNALSFLPLLKNQRYNEREVLTTYYNPMWGTRNLERGVYAQNKTHKLYKNGNFYNYSMDLLEKNPIDINSMNDNLKEIYNLLNDNLNKLPDLPPDNFNGWKERGKEVRSSNKFDRNWKLNLK